MDKLSLIQMLMLAGDGPISRLWEELKLEVQVAYSMFVAIASLIIAFWMRRYILLLGFIVVAMVVGVLIWDASFVAEGGRTTARFLFEGWLDE